MQKSTGTYWDEINKASHNSTKNKAVANPAEEKAAKKAKISLKLVTKVSPVTLPATKVATVLAAPAPVPVVKLVGQGGSPVKSGKANVVAAAVKSPSKSGEKTKITRVTPQRMTIPVAVAARVLQEEEISASMDSAIDIGSDPPVTEYELEEEFEAMD